ncbi:type II CAAX prenyl endopeptidase Rce1 family protein [Parasphingorhabdus sp.]|uniref:CPBP family glutamic-type intramembrane protease n=1 Tax=Parasphingorhabdus sp. TaxID=2709688 RepID=UPI003A8D7B42
MKIWPDAGRWKAAVGVAVPAAAIISLLGYLGEWLHFDPVGNIQSHLITVAILFFVPAFLIEFIFRGVLLSWLAAFSQRWGSWLSAFLFMLWHPFLALTFEPPWAAIYLQPSFLFATFILGIILTHIRIVSKSLWPVVVIHWILVVLWRLFFGGPFY